MDLPLPVADAALPSIVFVTGASRSGTTMLNRILANHSAILGLNELHYFGDVSDVRTGFAPVRANDLKRMAAILLARQARGIWGGGPTSFEHQRASAICETLPVSQRHAYGVFAAVLRSISQESGKRIACEQTPRNIYYSAQLLAAFPDARIIHIVRDPRAVLASQKNRWKLRRLGAKHVPWTELLRNWVNYHPITASKLWTHASNCAMRLLEHPRFMMTRFEDIVSNPQQEVERICRFLGIDFELRMLDVNQWGSSNLQHEMQKRGISSEVVSQWETSLGVGELVIAERLSRGLMQRLNYELRSNGGWRTFSALPHVLTYPAHLIGVFLANPGRAWIQVKATLSSSA